MLNKFNKLKVLIVGDVMIDRYMYGKVNRISPEAPVPIVELQRTEERLGGAANVALNIKALGATPYLYSVVGDDTEGSLFVNIMAQYDLPTQGILQSSERQTTVKTRVMAGTHQMLRLDSEIKTDLNRTDVDNLLSKIEFFLDKEKIDVIILQDYNKGVLSIPIIQNMMAHATKKAIQVAVDPKKNNFFAYKNATLFKPNLKEIRDALPFEVTTSLESLQRASDYLRTHLGQQYTMITLSEKGLFLEADTEFTSPLGMGVERNAKIYPTQSRNISDVSGAGDTVISVAALGLAAGFDAETIALLSNLAGGQVCEFSGVVSVNKKQLENEYDQILTAKKPNTPN